MFYYIKGKLVFCDASVAVIDVGGVAYKMTISGNTQTGLSAKALSSGEALLYTHLSVREDGIELFGFATTEELATFKQLISVSGVGPKAAMSILSFMKPQEVALAVCTEDKKSISKAPGIGPKTAARIILELKDKMHADSISASESTASGEPIVGTSGKIGEALDALTVLGFNRSVAAEALKGIDIEHLELEDIIRDALKKLMK